MAAAAAVIAAFVLGGYLGPLLLVGLAILPAAAVARVLGRLVRLSLLVSLPIGLSVVLVTVFTRAGTTVLFTIGPFDATLEGVDFAAGVLVRLIAMTLAVGLFGLTTEPRAFVADLERRGLPPRLAFVAAATLETLPALIERAGTIAAAQRARALDTEGSLRARIQGVMPLVGPVLLSSLTEVEERSLALEVRAFGRPGRRKLLWALPDPPIERAARWAIVAALVALAAGRFSGLLPPGP